MRGRCRRDIHRSGFQSAPAIAGGRCPATMRTAALPCCFNPRPPLLAGDACARACAPVATKVSIRARHCWRAMRSGERFNRRRPKVSIRARHCWRAMLQRLDSMFSISEFQSAPAIAGGRCSKPNEAHHASSVSIRARHCWRAMLAGLDVWGNLCSVSIRARHCWRAMPALPRGGRQVQGFNPRPPLLAGDARTWARHFPLTCSFNPRPPLLAGDARLRRRRRAPPPCFNPRPPLLAGDAIAIRGTARDADVSIRARHCWRAMLSPSLPASTFCAFQSAPAIAGGRCAALPRGGRQIQGFNPRPPLLAGDAQEGKKTWAQITVSIRARHCWRAMLAAGQLGCRRVEFQSAPAIAGGRCVSSAQSGPGS